MNEHNARLVTLVAVVVCLSALWFRGRSTHQPVARTAIGAMLVGGVLYLLAPVAPSVVIPAAGLLIADVLVLPHAAGQAVLSDGIANALTPVAAATPSAPGFGGGGDTPGAPRPQGGRVGPGRPE